MVRQAREKEILGR
ncbi:unnamed protein product [Calypogeia fissa]